MGIRNDCYQNTNIYLSSFKNPTEHVLNCLRVRRRVKYIYLNWQTVSKEGILQTWVLETYTIDTTTRLA